MGLAKLEIPWSHAEATLFDMVGNSRDMAPVAGKLTLDVGPYPIFVQP